MPSVRAGPRGRRGRPGVEHGGRAVPRHALAELSGLSPTEWKALDLIQRLGPMTAGVLARESGLAPASVTGLISRLERKGFAGGCPTRPTAAASRSRSSPNGWGTEHRCSTTSFARCTTSTRTSATTSYAASCGSPLRRPAASTKPPGGCRAGALTGQQSADGVRIGGLDGLDHECPGRGRTLRRTAALTSGTIGGVQELTPRPSSSSTASGWLARSPQTATVTPSGRSRTTRSISRGTAGISGSARSATA